MPSHPVALPEFGAGLCALLLAHRALDDPLVLVVVVLELTRGVYLQVPIGPRARVAEGMVDTSRLDDERAGRGDHDLASDVEGQLALQNEVALVLADLLVMCATYGWSYADRKTRPWRPTTETRTAQTWAGGHRPPSARPVKLTTAMRRRVKESVCVLAGVGVWRDHGAWRETCLDDRKGAAEALRGHLVGYVQDGQAGAFSRADEDLLVGRHGMLPSSA